MPTTTRVTMPQLGESVHEGTISRWLVQPGEKVVEFEPMLEVDTDKVSAEVPAPVSGILREILAKEGETVQAGAEIAVVELEEAGGEPPAGRRASSDGDDAEQARPKAPAAVPKAKKPGPALKPEPVDPAAREKKAARVTAPAPASAASSFKLPSGEHRFSPAVIILAQEHGVDLGALRGTGIGGRVTKKDVQGAIDGAASKPAAGAQPSARPAAAPAQPSDGDQAVPLSRVRKLIADKMVLSKTTIPHAWQTQEVDMTGVVANRAANKASYQAREGQSLTYLPYVVGAAVAALRDHPEVNATFNVTEILVHRDINVGISVGMEDRLVVPVIRRADGLSLAGLARAIGEAAEKARTKKLTADDLNGGTFTVNNSGTFGTLFSYSVINPGQAGILTMEAIVERPVAVAGMIGIKPMMYLCFSFDHRVLDGLAAARFLTSCRQWLQGIRAETPIY